MPINNPPVQSGLPSTIFTAEDEPVALNNGIAIDPPPAWISDADSASVTTTLSAVDGSFSVAGSGTAVVTGNGTNTVTITGTPADVNLAVYHASYTPPANVFGSRTLTLSTTDGTGSDTDTITVSILSVKDTPEGADVTHSATEDTPYVLHAADFGFSDIDGDSLASIELASTPLHGKIVDVGGYINPIDITGDGVPDVFLSAPPHEFAAGETIDLTVLAGGYIRYVPETNAYGIAADSFTYQVIDNGGTPGATLDPTPNTMTFDIAGTNDMPTVTIATTFTTAGGETRVNTTIANDQQNPAIATLPNGGYVLVWQSAEQDGSSWGIYQQRYNAAGNPVGTETRVNSFTDNEQGSPSVAALAGGGYVVTWQSGLEDGSGFGIYAKQYNASGIALAGEILVNSVTAGNQNNPSVAALTAGGYVVTWQSADASGWGIYTQRYDASGTAVGGETLVNTTTANHQFVPVVAGLAGGGYVVTWESDSQDGSGYGVYAQRFDASGVAQGIETRVTTTTFNDQERPAITALADGGYVVTWSSFDQDAAGTYGVYAQRYNASGVAQGGETLVNTTTAGSQTSSSVSALVSGGYVVTWQSLGQDGSSWGVYQQHYDAAGDPEGGETLVNTTTANTQAGPAVLGLADGGYVVAWESQGQDNASTNGVYLQRYSDPFGATEQVPVSLKGMILVDDADGPSEPITVTLSVDFGILDVTAGTSGAGVTGSGSASVEISGTLAQVQALLDSDGLSTLTYTADSDTPPASATLDVTVDDGVDQVTASRDIAITAVNDTPVVTVPLSGTISGIEGTAIEITGLEVADAEAGSAIVTVNIFSDHGSIHVSESVPGGVTSVAGNDQDLVVVSFSGTMAQINTTLAAANGVTLNAGADYNGPVEVTFLMSDMGYSGVDPGGPLPTAEYDVKVFTVDVLPANDAPTVTIAAISPASAPEGSETLVNTTTDDYQILPAIAALADGGYVVTWQSFNQDGDSFGVYMQRYDAAGTPLGSETLVNSTPISDQMSPSVAALAGGGYVVTWQSSDQDGDSNGVFAQRYDASGTPLGSETQVNSYTTSAQSNPAVAALAGGGYVVTWQSSGQDGDNYGIYAQRYDAAGNPQGSEAQVNGYTTSAQLSPAIAALAGGGYVVTWQSLGQDGDNYGVYAKHYDASGNPLSIETLVNSYTVNSQSSPSVTGLAGGGYVVTWQSLGQEGSGREIYQQRYDASDNPVGGETRVNSFTPGEQTNPTVAALADGGYVVTWTSADQDGDGHGIYQQRYDASGNPAGGETLVNSITAGEQSTPVAAGLSDGAYVVAWHSGPLDGSTADVYAQRFGDAFGATEQVALSLKGTILVGDVDGPGESITVTLSVDFGVLDVDAGTSGAIVTGGGSTSVVISGTLAEVQALLVSDAASTITYTADSDAPPALATLDVSVADGVATTATSYPIAITAINDAPALDLDLFAGGNDAALSWTEDDGPVALAPNAVFSDDNTSFNRATLTVAITDHASSSDQLTILSVGDGPGEIRIDGSDIYFEGNLVGSFTGGDNGNTLVATFNSVACHCAIQMVMDSIAFEVTGDAPSTDQRTIGFTLNDGGGTALGGADSATAQVLVDVTGLDDAPTVSIVDTFVHAGGETLVNTTTANHQQVPRIAALTDGGFVVTWAASGAQDGSGYGVYAQRYDAAGTPVGGETQVNSFTTGDQSTPSVAALAGGGYVVTWYSVGQDGSGYGVYQQLYDASGTPVGAETQVNSYATNDQGAPSVAGLAGGGYVVTWHSLGQDGSGYGIYEQLYDASGAPVGSETLVNSFVTNHQFEPSVTGLADGGYVVTWQSGQDGSGYGIYQQRYDASGAAVGGEALVNTGTANDQSYPSATALTDGGYVVTWQSHLQDGSGDGIYAQRYDAAGDPVGGETLVNTVTASDQRYPSATALTDGGYVVTWESDAQDGSGTGVYLQQYDVLGDPVGGETLVNTTTESSQSTPVVKGLSDGSYVVAWQSFDQDSPGTSGVYLQRFFDPLHAIEQVALSLKGTITIDDVDTTGDVTVTLDVVSGTLHVEAGSSGVDVNELFPDEVILTGTVAEIQALLGSDPTSVVTYTADTDFPPPSDDLTVTIDDGTTTATDTQLITITPVNDAPEVDLDFFASGNDAVTVWTEGDGPQALAYYAAFDDDNDGFDGAVLTITIGGATSGDQLTIEDFGTGSGELGLDGANVTYEGDIVGTWSGGIDGAPLVITFNAEACHCAVELTMGSILYENTDDLTAGSSRTVDFTLIDGAGTALGGEDTGSASVHLTVLPFAEVIPGAGATGDEDAVIPLTGVVIDGVALDPASDIITVRLDVDHGTLDIRTDVSGGIAAGDVTGDDTAHLVLTGTQDAINATLAASGGLTYQGDAEYSGSDALSIEAVFANPGGPPEFHSIGELPLGLPVTALATADFDGDGTDDLVIGTVGGVAVYGSILGGIPVPDGDAVFGVAVTDIDGDGELDIAYAANGIGGDDGAVGYISSVTGDAVELASVEGAFDIVTGDFNGDGRVDIAATDRTNGRVAVLLHDTVPGTFLAPVFTATTTHATLFLATGDVNGDNVLDLLVGNYGDLPDGDPPGSVDLMLGNGDGTFAAAVQVASSVVNVGEIVTGDFDHDGALDFVFASSDDTGSGGGGVEVVLGNGDGSFAAPVVYTTTLTGTPAYVVTQDFNGDGELDLAVANFDDPGTFSVLLGNGDGSFQAPVDFDTVDAPRIIVTGDPDDDGDYDLVVGSVFGDLDLINNDAEATAREADAIKYITINIVDDAAVANNDTGATVAEDATVNIDVLANDSDVDGPTPSVATVNGVTLLAGQSTTLASGAIVTLEGDGTLTYDPNDKFNTLISAAKATATGAANDHATDSFGYTVDGGDAATVTVTVTGVDSSEDWLVGTGGNDVITGTPAVDLIFLNDGGDDTATGLASSDGFYMGDALSAGDNLDGGAGINDQLGLQGDYSAGYTFSATNLVNIEQVVLLAGDDTRFGASPGSWHYNLTTVNANVAAGATLTVNASALLSTEGLTFNGAAETDGAFRIFAGQGVDSFTGGQQSDGFFFGDNNRFTAADHVDGQGGTDDQLGLRGDYSAGVTFTASTMTGIETIVLLSASNVAFAPPGTAFDYNLTLDDANVGVGEHLMIQANGLQANESASVDGSAESDGWFTFMGGLGDDHFIGGAGNDAFYGRGGADTMTGNGGNDTFYYRNAADSTLASLDHITDFTLGDTINLANIDANIGAPGNNAFAFIGNAAFSSTAGELRASFSGGLWTVEGDTNGDGVADIVIHVTTTGGHSLVAGDFVL